VDNPFSGVNVNENHYTTFTGPLEDTHSEFRPAEPIIEIPSEHPTSTFGINENPYTAYKGPVVGELSEAARGTSALDTAADFAGKAGDVLGVAGIGLSGLSLGSDIAEAFDNKKVTFDNAMKMADDGTGIVSGAVSFIPGVGVPLSLALLGGEKLITSGVKIAKAVAEEKKREGVKHLSFDNWINTAEKAVLPEWMTIDVKDIPAYWRAKKQAKKDAAEAEKKRKEWNERVDAATAGWEQWKKDHGPNGPWKKGSNYKPPPEQKYHQWNLIFQ
jgi:hypothetical protein